MIDDVPEIDPWEWECRRLMLMYNVYRMSAPDPATPKHPHRHGNCRPVVRDDGAFFWSVKEAANGSDTFAQHISHVATGRWATAGGHGWRYATEEEVARRLREDAA